MAPSKSDKSIISDEAAERPRQLYSGQQWQSETSEKHPDTEQSITVPGRDTEQTHTPQTPLKNRTFSSHKYSFIKRYNPAREDPVLSNPLRSGLPISVSTTRSEMNESSITHSSSDSQYSMTNPLAQASEVWDDDEYELRKSEVEAEVEEGEKEMIFQRFPLKDTNLDIPSPDDIKVSHTMIHSRLSNPELTRWIESVIQEKIAEDQPAYAKVNDTYRRNMMAFYSAFLRKEFVQLTSKLVVMDSGQVFIMDYDDSDMGERKAMVNVAKRFKGRSVWIMPAKGYWTSSWFERKGITTPAFPSVGISF